jgi:hypothetical protein
MANNCLVTKLKGVVDNDNLQKLGELMMKVINNPSAVDGDTDITINVLSPCELYVSDGGAFADSPANVISNPQTRTTIQPSMNGTHLYFKNANYNVYISNKYNITQLSISGVPSRSSIFNFSLTDVKYSISMFDLTVSNSNVNGDLSDILTLTNLSAFGPSGLITGDIIAYKNWPNLTSISLTSAMEGDISVFNNRSNLTAFVCNSCHNISGNISNISGNSNLTYLACMDSGVSGSINSISSLTKLERLHIGNSGIGGDFGSLGAMTVLKNVNIENISLTGTIESFVYGQCHASSNPRTSLPTSSAINIYGPLLPHVTFGGKNYEGISFHLLSWESETKIAIGYGSTTFANCQTVYCKGYGTQEQAEAAFPGKNVIRVDA